MYVYMHHSYVNMQHNYIDKRDNYVDMRLTLHVVIKNLHTDKKKRHMYIIILQIDIIYIACRDRSIQPYM